MILAFDTYYYEHKAKTVCLAFESWLDDENYNIYTEIVDFTEDYTSGEFFRRELPCILSLLLQIPLDNVDAIIVDGFVFLDDNYKLGLGGHLYEKLEHEIPVIGVAKTNFATIDKKKRALLRGASIKPLYITAIGMDLDLATKCVESMSGSFRIPTLLKVLDTFTKEK
jgi:deoxyribonuclease V